MAAFLNSLKNHGHLNPLHMTVCNVGSRKISASDDYGSAGWHVFAPNLSIYGFDADADACHAANNDLEARGVNWTEKHVPLALSDRDGESTLYVTKAPMCSSLFAPKETYLSRFQNLAEYASLDFTIGLETTTLDAFCQTESVRDVDFLQVDVQGADLLVLQGARELLSRSVLSIQIEVEFSALYEHQPLFADIDTYLRGQGFTLFDLTPSYRVRNISPIQSTFRQGQLLWADAFYMRDLLSPEVDEVFKTPENFLKLACIADLLNFPDYAIELLVHLTQDQISAADYNFANVIVEVLAQYPPLVERGLASLTVIQAIQNFVTDPALQKMITS